MDLSESESGDSGNFRSHTSKTHILAKNPPLKSARAPLPKLKKGLKPVSINPTSNDIEDPLSRADVVVTYLLSPGVAPVANMTSRDEPSIDLGENFRSLYII